MGNEEKLILLLDQFVDDLNAGITPRIYKQMAADNEIAELLPLLDMAAWISSSVVEMNPEKQAEGKVALLRTDLADVWSMQRLIEESDGSLIAQHKAVGLTTSQITALSSDVTPLDIDAPNKTVQHLAEKYGVGFWDLLGWVRQLISNVIGSNSQPNLSAVYTREKNRDNHSSSKED